MTSITDQRRVALTMSNIAIDRGRRAESSALRIAAWATTVGLVGVVAVSVCYAMSPEPTVMPVVPIDLDAAMAGAASGAPTISLISAIGMPADILTAAGAALLAYGRFFERGRGSEALGWLLVALASLFFLGTDTIAGSVLAPLAIAGDRSAFLAVKTLLDFFFVAGTLGVALGAIFAGFPNFGAKNDMPRSLSFLLLLTGLAGLAASAATLAGVSVPKPLGISVAAAAAFFAIASIKIARERDSASRSDIGRGLPRREPAS